MCTLKNNKDIFTHNHSRINTHCSILLCVAFLAICDCSKYIANLYFTTDDNYSIHNVKLETKLCHIRYGLYRPIEYLYTPNEHQKKVHYDSLFCEGYINEFPEAHTDNYVLGGCGEYSQKFERIQYCPMCNENKKQWLKENNYLKPFTRYDIRNQNPRYRSHNPRKKKNDSLFFSHQPFGKYSKNLTYREVKSGFFYFKRDFLKNIVDSVIFFNDSGQFFHRNVNINVNKNVTIHGKFVLFIVENLLLNVERGTYHDPEAPEEYIIEISSHGKYVGCNDCLGLMGYEKRQIRKVDWLMRRLIKKYLTD